MFALMLIDAVDPRYGGAPDPDEERRRRWEPVDRRVLMSFLGSFTCIAVGSVTEPAATAVGFHLAAAGFCYAGVRAAWPRVRQDKGRPGDDAAD